MTADEWATSEKWRAILSQLDDIDGGRKLRLWTVAIGRHILDCHAREPISNWFTRLGGPANAVFTVAEHFADGHATPDQLSTAAHASGGPHQIFSVPAWRNKLTTGYVGRTLTDFMNEFGLPTARTLSDLLRDIFGNPFRPVVFDPRWRSESAVALARTSYDTRNFTLLPILADALEEAGCDNPDVLTHCREPNGVHVRGCWVIDGVLGMT